MKWVADAFLRGTALLAAVFTSLLLGTPPAMAQSSTPSANACPAILQYSFNRLQDEAPQKLCQYAGKVLLVVNTASYCGFTPQYEHRQLLRLHPTVRRTRGLTCQIPGQGAGGAGFSVQ
ncbi:MAG: hypothetical protein RLZZ371_1897 [Pseudomonadota bacterium]